MNDGLKHVLERKGWISDDSKRVEFTCDVLPLDTVNRNNRYISKEVAEKAIAEWKDRPIPCRVNMPRTDDANYPIFENDPREICGWAQLSIEDDKVVGKVRMLPDTECPSPEFQKFLIDGIRSGTMVPAPYGGGNVTVDENGVEHVQDDYQISGIGIIDKKRSVL